MRKILPVIGLLLLATSSFSVHAETLQKKKSSGDLTLSEASANLAPWLDEVKQKIGQQPNYQNVAEALLKQLSDHQKAIFYFNVKETGDIENFETRKTSGLEKADRLVRELVSNTAPFPKPSNNLPCAAHSGVLLEFCKKGNLIEISACLSRLLKARIGEENETIRSVR